MTATTRSASMTPSSMSFASSEASLTLCSGTLRTSIGAGTGGFPFYGGGASVPRARSGWDGADVVPGDGVGDVLQGGDDGAGAAPFEEAQRALDLGSHAA